MNTVIVHKRRLQGHIAKDQTFTKLDLSDLLGFQSKWTDCTFDGCDITLADFSGATFEGCTFVNCDFRLTSFRAAAIRDSTFTNCNLRKTSFFSCAPLQRVIFDRCKMHYAGFSEASVYECSFLNCNLHGADLRFVEARHNDFAGSLLWGASLQMSCQFWNGKFDERTTGMFLAFVARVHPTPETATILRELSGEHYAVAARLMDVPSDRVKEGEDGL